MAAIAGQTHDVVLNGDGYMLAQAAKGASHYKRGMVGSGRVGLTPGSSANFEVLQGPVSAPVHSFRRAIWSKWSGLGQGMVAGAEGWQQAQSVGRVNDLLSLRPVQDGAALALVPQGVAAVADAGVLSFANVFCVTLGSITVISFDTKIYVSANPGTNNCGFVLKATASAVILGMCIWNGQVLVSVNGTLNTFNPTSGAFTAFTPATTAGTLASYQGVLVSAYGTQLSFLIAGTWVTGPTLENGITSQEELNGSLYIGTLTALYRLDGVLQPKSPATAPNTLDYFSYKISIVWRAPAFNAGYWTEYNFSNLTAWKGYLWFFANGQLYRAAPVQGHDTMQPEPQPITGLSLGLRVCGKFLVVITRQVSGGACTIWANDGLYDLSRGLGWFKVATGGQWFHPFPNVSYSQGMVNVATIPGANSTFTRFLFDPVSPVGWNASNYGVTRTAVSGKVILPLVTPEDLAALAGATDARVLAVNLRRVGVEWSLIDGGTWWPSVPPDGPTLSAFQVAIEISNNAGVTWATLVEPSVGALSTNLYWFYGNRFELPVGSDLYVAGVMYPAAPPAGGPGLFGPVPDMGWLVRVTWGGLVMPLLRRVWLDYDVCELQPQTGRAWEFEVVLQDPLVDLDGTVDPGGDAAYKVARLSTLVKTGQSVTFSDLDGQNYLVRVVGLDVKRISQGALPALAPGWQGTVRLEEVWPGN